MHVSGICLLNLTAIFSFFHILTIGQADNWDAFHQFLLIGNYNHAFQDQQIINSCDSQME